MMTTTEAYYGVGLLALLWGTYYFQMSDDKKRFGGETCVLNQGMSPFGDVNLAGLWSSDEELLCDEKDPNQFEDPPFVTEIGGPANEERFFQAQIAYHEEHSHSFDLKGSIHANLIDICGIAIDIVRDPYYQIEARDEIESKVRQTDSFMTTYMDETDGGDKDLLESYHDIWERLERIGVLAQKQSY